MYDDISKTVNILEMIDLVHIPEVHNVLAAELEVLEDVDLKELIADFKGKERRCYETLFRDSRRGDESLYWFELSRFAESDWELTRMRPFPPPYEPYKELMSGQIIEKITSGFPVNPDKVVTLKAEPSGWLSMKVDLQFVRFSVNHLFGTVKENLDDWEGKFPGEPGMWGTDLEMAHRVFFYYLHKFPSLAKDFIQIFTRQILPVSNL